MKRFQFRLDPLLRFREHLLEQAQLEVARVRTDIEACRQRIAGFEKDYEATTHELDGEVSTGIDSKRYRHYVAYLKGIESQLEAENLRRMELAELLDKKTRELQQRSVDKKVLENLKNRRREDYYRETMRMLHKETDDAVTLREARNMAP